MRANFEKVIFIAVFILYCAAPALPSDLLQVETQGAGMLSLPSVWSVMSKDDAPLQNLAAGLNVQQALYARAESAAAQDAALQIFLIWWADGRGNEKPVPYDLVGALISARHGNVSELGEDIVDTVLGSLIVATYGAVEFMMDEDSPEFRYKRAALYQGDKRVLVLLRYRPEFEDYWHGHFEAILNEWVGSLTFAVRRVLVAMPMPEIILPTARLPIPRALPVEPVVTPLPEQYPYEVESIFVWFNGLVLLLIVLLLILVARILVVRRRLKTEQELQEAQEMQFIQEVRKLQGIQEVREIRATQEQEIEEAQETEEVPKEQEPQEIEEVPEAQVPQETEEAPKEQEPQETEEAPKVQEPQETEEVSEAQVPQEIEEAQEAQEPQETEEAEEEWEIYGAIAPLDPPAVPLIPPVAAPENNNRGPVWLPTFEEWLAEERLVQRNTEAIHDSTGEKGFNKVQTLLGEALGNLKDTEKPEE